MPPEQVPPEQVPLEQPERVRQEQEQERVRQEQPAGLEPQEQEPLVLVLVPLEQPEREPEPEQNSPKVFWQALSSVVLRRGCRRRLPRHRRTFRKLPKIQMQRPGQRRRGCGLEALPRIFCLGDRLALAELHRAQAALLGGLLGVHPDGIK